ncbi:CRE-GCS-1 protein, partial [Aphelenchoides avenae]
MGLLKDGLPLTWEQIVPHLESIKNQGIMQFINLYHRTKGIQGSEFKWGDEVEFVIIKFDHAKKKVRVATKAHDLLDLLQAEQRVCSKFHEGQNGAHWTPEFAGYMIEGIPEAPYG